jgi:hypothetical protein
MKIEETALLFQPTNGCKEKATPIDYDMRPKIWLHPAFSLTVLEEGKEDTSTIQFFLPTEANKNTGLALGLPYSHQALAQRAYNTGYMIGAQTTKPSNWRY